MIWLALDRLQLVYSFSLLPPTILHSIITVLLAFHVKCIITGKEMYTVGKRVKVGE